MARVTSTAVLALLLVASSVVAAQEKPPPASREELLRHLRESKRESVRPYRPNAVEMQFLSLDKAEKPTIADLNWKGFYPRIAWPSRGSGAALGARYWKRDVLGPVDVSGAAFYSIYNYQHYDVQLGLIPHRGNQIPQRSWRGDELYEIGDVRPGFPRFPLYVTFRYRYLPEEDFYGLGPDSSLSNRTNYFQEEIRAYLRTGLQVTRNFVWILEGGYQANSLGPGKTSSNPTTGAIFDASEAPGLDDPPDYVRLGTQLFFDFRDEPGNPHEGWMLALIGERFLDRTEGNFSFDRVGFDARGYLPLGSLQRILALRSALVTDHPGDGDDVPFFMQESLGGSHTLRGFDSFRFRGEKVALLQAEYRWEPTSFWELAVFTDAGSVGRLGSSFGDLEWDYGFGMRFKSYRDIVLRFEIAFSAETTRYYIRGSQSF
ncbi:MAG: BamA/TamA family outer membrane protein [Vicinamibacteria bacterium]